MKHNRAKLLVGAVALLLGFAVSLSPIGSALDNVAYDLNFVFDRPGTKESDVVLIGIDEASFQELGMSWPWPRSTHADLIDALFNAGARVVALDLILAEPAADDQRLVESLRQQGPVILATDEQRDQGGAFSRVISVQPLSKFQTSNVFLGSAKLPVDADGFVRGFGAAGAMREPSFAEATLLANGTDGASLSTNDSLIRFTQAKIPSYSYYQALDPDTYLPQNALTNKIAVVGLTTSSEALGDSLVGDTFPTPLTRWGDGYMSGVEIHAHAIRSLLTANQIRVVNSSWVILFSLVGGLLAVWIMLSYNPLRTVLPMSLLLASTVAASLWLFHAHNQYLSWPVLILPTAIVSIISPVFHFLVTWRERNFIQKAFSSYVPERVVSQLMDNPDLLKPGGSLSHGSVLFLDLQGFTTMAESLSPERTVDMLNALFSELSEIVIDQGGMVDKFIGDAIMAVWGAPLADDNHAQNACRAALKMREHLLKLNQGEEHSPQLQARIGINSGDFIAGNLGGERKVDYTVIGDTVNVAARLESANREHQTDILIGEATAQLLDSREFEVREIGALELKGKQSTTLSFELIGSKALEQD